ncbi:YciI family protein [Luteimonas sp. SX5]|uniref:YciI family protein n=1 Tax=Luteimonas galliterrae TaxID=2940486 RepID=A0ABT0MFH1_9GAMM|nr:YciI family protein [Luteimonas galliterrae]MCL1633609.1 YciI family protein [Luteimonas galliterrae]
MRVMVFVKAAELGDAKAPTPEELEAFAAMDRFTEELVTAGVFVAAAGLKTGAEAKRITFDGTELAIVDGPFAESKEVVAGFSIWQVRDMNEALAWVKRAPLTADSIMEILPFYEAEDLAAFVTPEELATPRSGERGKLGVA